MSLNISGGDSLVTAQVVTMVVSDQHPLIKLANALPWLALIDLILPDLKKSTAKGYWWLGRKILVRVHLAAFFLQKLYNLTDRQIEYGIKDNAVYQLFTGKGIVQGWQTLDHTKIEEFRSRLTAETQRALANALAQAAVTLGFADPSKADFGHTKHGGQLGKSRMKSDATTLAAGYASVLGFNLRQISRRQRKGMAKAA
jgi:IS5 family transposase